jgi:hypothetical protein
MVSRLRLRRFDRRLDRLWRRGQVDRVLSALRSRTGPASLTSARTVSTDPVCVAEIAWPDGFCVRVGLCHPGAVADLGRLVADGRVVTLRRAVYSGQMWSLDFAHGGRSFPLLAGVITLPPGGGDVAPLAPPPVPQNA